MNQSNQSPMSESRALAIINAYGGAPECWPGEERDDLLALSWQSAAVSAAMADALSLDHLLNQSAPAHSIGALKGRIMNEVMAQRQSVGARWAQFFGFSNARTGQAIWQPIGVMAVSAIMGMVAGTALLDAQAIAKSNSSASVDQVIASLDDTIIEGVE